jgi:hypothetical protein
LIFIAVFDILLMLLNGSGTGEAHAYADDLAHLAKTLEAQQRQADLVCGFVACTGIEISVPKVEAISVFNSRIMYDITKQARNTMRRHQPNYQTYVMRSGGSWPRRTSTF